MPPATSRRPNVSDGRSRQVQQRSRTHRSTGGDPNEDRPLEARRRRSGAFPRGSRIVDVGGSQNARPLDLTRDVHAPASVSGSLPHRGTSSTAGVRGTSVAAFQAQQPQSHGRFSRLLSADTGALRQPPPPGLRGPTKRPPFPREGGGWSGSAGCWSRWQGRCSGLAGSTLIRSRGVASAAPS